MFQFKQFAIDDNNCSMKVGTDAVLLGALVSPTVLPHRILDIGTGCGIIAMMMAQRFNQSHVDAIDIDDSSIQQCASNFNNTPFNARLTAIQSSLQKFHDLDGYDLIVSNPPFFENSLKAPNQQRSLARHTDTLSFEDLIKHTAALLKPQGELWIIVPFVATEKLKTIGKTNQLSTKRIIAIRNSPNKEFKRAIICMINGNESDTISEAISIRNTDNTYSEWYKQLTEPFYTHLK